MIANIIFWWLVGNGILLVLLIIASFWKEDKPVTEAEYKEFTEFMKDYKC